MSVTPEVSQPEMSALKSFRVTEFGYAEGLKSPLMSVMAETFHSAMGPHVAVAAVGFASNARTAVIREALVVKIQAKGGGEGEAGGDGDDGDGGEEAVPTVIDSTVMPSAAEAAAGEPTVAVSEVSTVAAGVAAGTAMAAVMITLAAATLMVTSDLWTAAAVAMPCCKLEVSE